RGRRPRGCRRPVLGRRAPPRATTGSRPALWSAPPPPLYWRVSRRQPVIEAMSQDDRDVYDPAAIEARWQHIWEERGTNRVPDARLRSAARPFYNLMMFPYPSAEG